MDNWSVHCTIENELQTRVNSHGALLLWNPPNSPDLNPIEKLWDVVLKKMLRCLTELSIGMRGLTRPFALGDFIDSILRAWLNYATAVATMEECLE